MKVLHLSALDGQTGAGVAAARIHAGLIERGVNSRFCAAHLSEGLPGSFKPRLTLAARVDRAVRNRIDGRLLSPHAEGYDYILSTGFGGHDVRRIVRSEQPDIVHLHWIAGNSFRLATLAGLSLPVLWRLSDMWPFCGIAHLEPQAQRYIDPPITGAQRPLWLAGGDLPEAVRRAKQRVYATLPKLTLAAPSKWMMAQAQRSALLGDRPIELIPTSCDTREFTPRDRRACRAALGLSLDAKLVLVGATSMGTRWKGGDLLAQAVVRLGQSEEGLSGARIVTFGKDPMDATALGGKAPIDHVGQIRDRKLMSILYNAADVFVAPSRMENLANTVLESLACGTPVVAFDIGGMPDMIEHEVNGWLAPAFDTESLAHGIRWALSRVGNERVRSAARNKILNEFSLDQEIDKYLAMYQRLLGGAQRSASAGGAKRAS